MHKILKIIKQPNEIFLSRRPPYLRWKEKRGISLLDQSGRWERTGAVLVGINERMQGNMAILSTLTKFELSFSLQVKITTKAGTGLDVKQVEEGEVRNGEISYIYFLSLGVQAPDFSPAPCSPCGGEGGRGDRGQEEGGEGAAKEKR